MRTPDNLTLVARAWWRSVEVFRVASLLYALVAYAVTYTGYQDPPRVAVVLTVMLLWTAWMWFYPIRNRRILWLDLAVTCGVTSMSWWADDPQRLHEGGSTIALTWVATPVFNIAVGIGIRGAMIAATCITAIMLLLTWVPGRGMLDSTVKLYFAGLIIGFAVAQVLAKQRQLNDLLAREAAIKERARLAADIHDSTLQALAYIQRRGTELGGEAAELARLAGKQEHTLRNLVAIDQRPPEASTELMDSLRQVVAGRAEVTGPQSVPQLPEEVVTAVVGAVGAALDNVENHAGAAAQAWVFVDLAPGELSVVVRDDGVGCDPTRLAEAEQSGRMGVSLGVTGRIESVGGSAAVLTAPGQGTEWEFVIPVQQKGTSS